MKKSLSLLLALAMVLGMFASVAAAADNALTTEQKYQQLVDSKVLKGTTDGKSHLEDNLTRAEFATIAVAVAGLEEDTASASAFADVKAGQWWTGAITAANKAGLVNGVGNGLFSPKANVTVQEAIKVAALIAKLTPVADATVEGSDAWAGPYIKAAQDAGLPLPTNYKEAATRGQTVDIAYAVFQSLQVKPLDEVKAVVNSDDTITVTGKTAGGVDGVKVAVGTNAAASATLNADGTFTYTTAKQAVGTYALTVTAYKGDAVVKSAEVSASIEGFAVASVTVVNGKQIAITFNKAVQEGVLAGGHSYKDGANNLIYYKLSTANVYPASAALSDDKKTVTLTFANAFANNTYEQLVITGLKSASGQTLSDYKQPINLADGTAPSVSEVTYSGLTATVKFSEAVKTVGTTDIDAAVSVDGVQRTLGGTPIGYSVTKDAQDKVTAITFSGLEAGKSYNVNIVAIEDLVGNRTDLTTTLTVPNDTTAPVITSATVEGSKLRLKFSEPVKTRTDATNYLDGVTGRSLKVTATGQTTVYSTTASDSNNEIVVDLGAWVTSSFLNTTVTVSGYQDIIGNNGGSFSQAVYLVKDTSAPVLQSVIVTGAHIIAKFDEALNAGVIGTPSYTFTSTDNVRLTGTLTYSAPAFVYDANQDGDTTDSGENQYIDLTVTNANLLSNSALKDGTYSIVLPAGAVVDTTGHANTSGLTLSVTVSGNAAAANALIKLSTVTQDATNPSKLTFAFVNKNTNAPVTLANSALDVSKLLVNGAALPTGTTLYFNSLTKDQIVAELPTGTIAVNGTRTVKVANISDESGNVLSTTTADIQLSNVTLKENVKPTALSASLQSDKTISVTLSENLGTNLVAQNANAVTGVEVWVNGNKVDTSVGGANPATFNSTNNVLTITLTNANSFAAGQTIQVKFVGSNLKDAQMNSIADTTLTVQ